MLCRRSGSNGVVFYQSPLLNNAGVPHAFSTRIGGVSARPFESLNLGNPGSGTLQDASEHIRENYRRLLSAIDAAGRQLTTVKQVHGAGVATIGENEPNRDGQEADAMVCVDPKRVVSIRVADCVPVLLAGADGRLVAAVHAGWRGVVAGVVQSAIHRMRQLEPKVNLLAAIGPCISADHYEVGGEVLDEFSQIFGDRAPIRGRTGERGRIDLREAVRLQLLDEGLGEDSIDMTDRCTWRDHDEFFSHRRDNGVTGRMAAVIGCGA